jgi:regulator of replication initiation timing
MDNYMTLSQTLHAKIDRMIEAYEHLKAENQMLRDELQVCKKRQQEQEDALLAKEDSADIKETEIAAIIEKLETALGTH